MKLTAKTCRSCGAPIYWAKTSNGKAIPLDVDPVPGGNIIVKDNGVIQVLTAENLRLVASALVSHFATCPNSASHRKTQ